jgi:hypothetical protein
VRIESRVKIGERGGIRVGVVVPLDSHLLLGLFRRRRRRRLLGVGRRRRRLLGVGRRLLRRRGGWIAGRLRVGDRGAFVGAGREQSQERKGEEAKRPRGVWHDLENIVR